MDVLPDDLLIILLAYLDVPDILAFRQSCRRAQFLCKQRIVWINASSNLAYSFRNIESLSTEQLEIDTRKAYVLANKWKSANWSPRRVLTIQTKPSTAISDLRLLPANRVLAVSKGIWSVLTLWDCNHTPFQSAKWSPKGAIFDGIAVNRDPTSEAVLAIGIKTGDDSIVQVLGLEQSFYTLYTLHTTLKPVNLQGHLIALSDHLETTQVFDWTCAHSALLRTDSNDVIQSNQCLQVIFAHESILVIRARSIHLFAHPTLRSEPEVYSPTASYCFGWSDAVSVAQSCKSPSLPFPALSLLVRAETDNPWSEDRRTVDLYTLFPNPQYTTGSTMCPYTFPPSLTHQIPSRRGSLRCTDLILGELGTAIWITPRNFSFSLTWLSIIDNPSSDLHPSEHESLVAAVFPGPLTQQVKTQVLESNPSGGWTALDYDERSGRIALGSGMGQVSILEL